MKDLAISSEAFDRLAYSFGFFLGDGCLKVDRRRENSFTTQFTKMDYEPLVRVQQELKAVFGKEWNIRNQPSARKNKGDWYVMGANGREVYEFFAYNTAFRTQLPEYYFSADAAVQKHVIAGLIDSDGSIHTARGIPPRCVNEILTAHAYFGNSELKVTKALESLCRMVGVRTGKFREQKTTHKPSYQITLNVNDIHKAAIPLVNKRRIAALAEYIEYRTVRSETKSSQPIKAKI